MTMTQPRISAELEGRKAYVFERILSNKEFCVTREALKGASATWRRNAESDVRYHEETAPAQQHETPVNVFPTLRCTGALSVIAPAPRCSRGLAGRRRRQRRQPDSHGAGHAAGAVGPVAGSDAPPPAVRPEIVPAILPLVW